MIELLLMKTLSATLIPLYHWKAEIISFLHVLIVWGVNMTRWLIKMRQSWGRAKKQTVDANSGLAHKEIHFVYTFYIHLHNSIFFSQKYLLFLVFLWESSKYEKSYVFQTDNIEENVVTVIAALVGG